MTSHMPNFLARFLRPFSSSKMSLSPETAAQQTVDMPTTTQKCTVAAGCFWGVEHAFRKHFKDQLLDAKVGYIGGDTKNPSYRAVCSGRTGRKSSSSSSPSLFPSFPLLPSCRRLLAHINVPLTAYLFADAEALQVMFDPEKVTYSTLI
ncbi:MAG: hypothetical protein Q9187_004444, partial [Circinaria calcarea]